MNFPIRGYNEAMITYILAIASPTHPVDASYWQTGWAGSGYVNGNTWFGHKLFVGPNLGGPLFFAHYSYMGFDPRNIKDQYANYFEQNRNHTYINRSYCIANPLHHLGYNENCWGLTASDDPWGYFAHAPGINTDNGTLTPAAAIPSMPYTPAESISAMRHFYQVYGEDLWGEYGFYDAFNPDEDWFADSYLAIDEGPIINMIENYRSGLLWSNFMANEEIAPALAAIGFTEDVVSIDNFQPANFDWTVYPTIGDGTFDINMNTSNTISELSFEITDELGRIISFQEIVNDNDHYTIKIDHSVHGNIWIILTSGNQFIDAKAAWIK